MKIKKLILLLMCLLICALGVSSCDFAFRRSLTRVDLKEAYYILDDSTIYYTMYEEYDALRFDFAEVMETDQYGRRLIRYCACAPHAVENKNGDNVSSCLLICQKISDGFAYYYEDFCWVGTTFAADKVTYADFSSEEIDALKEKNDWNLPLDTNKMKKVCYTESQSEPDLTGIRENVVKHFGLSSEMQDRIGYNSFGTNNNGMYLVWVIIDAEHYFCVVDPADASIVSSEPFEGDPMQCQEALHAFKVENGFIE